MEIFCKKIDRNWKGAGRTNATRPGLSHPLFSICAPYLGAAVRRNVPTNAPIARIATMIAIATANQNVAFASPFSLFSFSSESFGGVVGSRGSGRLVSTGMASPFHFLYYNKNALCQG